MNVFQRQMFANGDEVVNVDRLIQYYTAQGYAPAEVTELVKGEFPAIETATVLDKMREARELFPVDAQRMPPTGTMDDIRRIDPNSVQFDDGSSVDMSGLISNIRQGEVSAEKVLALLNAPNAKLGSNLQQEVVSYLNRNLPGYSDLIVGEPGEFTDQRKFGIGSLEKEKQASMPFNLRSLARITAGVGAEETREGIEKLADFFGSETIGDMFRAEKYDGDPDAFIRRGGRTEPAFRDMVFDLNDPDQSMFKGAKDTITGLLENLNVDTTQFSDFLGKDPSEMILETDTVQRKRFEDAQIQNDIDNVSTEAKDGGQPVVENQEVSVIKVKKSDGDDDKKTGEEQVETPVTDDNAEPDITDGEATKRNFGEFIQSPDFIRFARNLGKGLATTGQIGQGIALGAAGAAEEKEAERQAEREAEIAMATKEGGFDRFLAEQRVKNTAPDKIAEQTTKLSEAINDIEQGDISMTMFNSVKEIMSESEITGLGAITNSLLAQAKGFLPGGSQEPTTPRERAIVILEQIANGNIKTITGESGRTISNVDRQIAEKLVGSLKNPLTRETEVLERIEAQIRSVTQRTNTARNKYDAIGLYFTSNGLPIPLRPRSYGVPTTEVSAANPYPNTTFIDATK